MSCGGGSNVDDDDDDNRCILRVRDMSSAVVVMCVGSTNSDVASSWRICCKSEDEGEGSFGVRKMMKIVSRTDERSPADTKLFTPGRVLPWR